MLAAAGLDAVRKLLERHSPTHDVVIVKLEGSSGIACAELLHAHDPKMMIVVLTGMLERRRIE